MLAGAELIGRYLFYVTVVPLDMPGSFCPARRRGTDEAAASESRSLRAALGVGHGGERYTYEDDERFGPMSASRRPERWVRTTCGYCSVGCGMLLGVRDGKAVAVQGDPDHPVNRGRLCPKGLTEHHTIGADGRLTHPIVDGRPASWDEALDRHGRRLHAG